MDFVLLEDDFTKLHFVLNKYAEIILLVIHAIKINISLQKSFISVVREYYDGSH